MPYLCRVEPERELGTILLSGRIDVDEFVASMETLYGHPDWEPGFCALWDGLGIARLILSPEDLAAIRDTYERLQIRMGVGRAAFVLPPETAQMIATLLIRRLPSPTRERRVFSDRDEALAWLAGSCDLDYDAA